MFLFRSLFILHIGIDGERVLEGFPSLIWNERGNNGSKCVGELLPFLLPFGDISLTF